MVSEFFENNKIPYICTPLTAKTKEEIFDQLEVILLQRPDLIEWRADYFSNIDDTALVVDLANKIKSASSIPLLFTIRSEYEMGEKTPLSEESRVALLEIICEKTDVDIIDYELSNEEKFIKRIKQATMVHNKQLILSYHNFDKTPSNDLFIQLAQKAETYDANIIKFAVMPNSKEDVLQLLEVTKMINKVVEVPLITMSMGEIGGLSRIVGWAYGSVVTFGVGVESSAPGQIPVEKLREAIQLTQQLVPSWM